MLVLAQQVLEFIEVVLEQVVNLNAVRFFVCSAMAYLVLGEEVFDVSSAEIQLDLVYQLLGEDVHDLIFRLVFFAHEALVDPVFQLHNLLFLLAYCSQSKACKLHDSDGLQVLDVCQPDLPPDVHDQVDNDLLDLDLWVDALDEVDDSFHHLLNVDISNLADLLVVHIALEVLIQLD